MSCLRCLTTKKQNSACRLSCCFAARLYHTQSFDLCNHNLNKRKARPIKTNAPLCILAFSAAALSDPGNTATAQTYKVYDAAPDTLPQAQGWDFESIRDAFIPTVSGDMLYQRLTASGDARGMVDVLNFGILFNNYSAVGDLQGNLDRMNGIDRIFKFNPVNPVHPV